MKGNCNSSPQHRRQTRRRRLCVDVMSLAGHTRTTNNRQAAKRGGAEAGGRFLSRLVARPNWFDLSRASISHGLSLGAPTQPNQHSGPPDVECAWGSWVDSIPFTRTAPPHRPHPGSSRPARRCAPSVDESRNRRQQAQGAGRARCCSGGGGENLNPRVKRRHRAPHACRIARDRGWRRAARLAP